MSIRDKKINYIAYTIILFLAFIHNPFSGYWDTTSNPWLNGKLITECATKGTSYYCETYKLPFWGWRSTGALIDWFSTIQNFLLSIAIVIGTAGAVRGYLNIKED
ncbi:hypothetical protein [Azonexus sp.]|uniref:hypothetical protein n=1 Tax=Azonexus sp. TaxID=1872668 RepID=UPI0027BACC76|nr:hypothetical protein [Azonexus sp.]